MKSLVMCLKFRLDVFICLVVSQLLITTTLVVLKMLTHTLVCVLTIRFSFYSLCDYQITKNETFFYENRAC